MSNLFKLAAVALPAAIKQHTYTSAKHDAYLALTAAQEAAHDVGGSAAIAGGAARDFALGGIPKDLDVIILGVSDEGAEHVLNELHAIGYNVDADFRRSTHDGQTFLVDYISNGSIAFEGSTALTDISQNVLTDDRWVRVIKLVSDTGLGVDLLFSKETSLQEAVHAFDFNINQYIITRPGRAPMYVGSTPPGTLHQNRTTQVTATRVAHIQSIAVRYNWSTAV